MRLVVHRTVSVINVLNPRRELAQIICHTSEMTDGSTLVQYFGPRAQPCDRLDDETFRGLHTDEQFTVCPLQRRF